MPDAGTRLMARPKGRPKAQEPTPPARLTIINLKGTQEQADWLDEFHRDTHIPRSVIVRLALAEFGAKHGRRPFPKSEEDR